jgi:hypothetical protein
MRRYLALCAIFLAACTPPSTSLRAESHDVGPSPATGLAVAAAAGEGTTTTEALTTTEAPTTTTTTEAPTTTAVPRTTVATTRPATTVPQAPRTTTAASATADFPAACIKAHESDTSGGYGAVNPNGHYGAYQVDDDFWLSYGGDPAYVGRENEAPPAMQDRVAAAGYAARGGAPWRGSGC